MLHERFSALETVYASYHDCVCYIGLDSTNGTQIFWYDFINSGISVEQQEARYNQLLSAKSVSSKLLLQILEVRREPGHTILVTEGTSAVNLHDYLKTSPQLQKTLMRWFRMICLAIDTLHHANITHGTLSLRMCYIHTSSGAFKLRRGFTRMHRTAPCVYDIGPYTAPEQLADRETKASDIWALGIILLELVTRQTPYREYRTPGELITAIKTGQLPASLAEVQDMAVRDLILQCLRPTAQRPTIEAVLDHMVVKETPRAERRVSGNNANIIELM